MIKPSRVCAISLKYMPSPEGDNRLDIVIREDEVSATYFSSSLAVGGARHIRITFTDCYAVRYFVTEEHEVLCEGFSESDSEFAEVRGSPWLMAQPPYVHKLKHYVLGINHCFFECIASGFGVNPYPTNR